ncbi:MAG: DUF624 domain-containing protein [Eubacteriales bacterium]|nr:DUF624 domain-containing protein [Eubacteriales bacterium]
MSGLFNTYFYGKAGKADFTPEQLPKNRLELFFTALRGQLSKMIGLNLIYDVFCIPMFFWLLLNYQVLGNYAAQTGSITGFVSDGYLSSFLIGMIPCLVLAGIGSSGQMYCLRNWARDQHSFMISDFKDSIKLNWKQGALYGLINGVSLYLLFICWTYYGAMAQTNMLFLVPQVFAVLIVAVWWMMNMIAYPMIVSYEMKFKDIVRNCALIAVARLPWSVLFLAMTVVLPIALLLLIPNVIVMAVVILWMLLIGFSFNGLVYASYANSCFDKYLNPRIEGAKVGQGLRDPALDFADEADEDEIRKEIESMK